MGKQARIVARLSLSFVPGLVMPAIGQHPKATGEICMSVLPSGRSCIDLVDSLVVYQVV
jgi:hypothetical protein